MKNMKKAFFSNCMMATLCLLVLLCSNTPSIHAKKDVTITNPLLYADVPDPDVICVGKDY